MPRIVRTARGDMVDFDAILIKQQIAQAPMNVEVARRKEFIDAKEGKKSQKEEPKVDLFVTNEPTRSSEEQAPVNFTATPTVSASDFEIEPTVSKKRKPVEDPVPVIPERT